MKYRIYQTGGALAVLAIMAMGMNARSGMATGRMLAADDSTAVDTAQSARQESRTTGTVADKNPASVIDEVVWVVGDEAILKSDVEVSRMSMEMEGKTLTAEDYCRIPEQIAIQKLFLHQAAIDSIEVKEAEIVQGVEQRINYWIQDPRIGSKERLEQLQRKSISQLRKDLHDDYKNQLLTQRMQQKLVEDLTVSPAEVRAYFNRLPADSIPMIPTQVEVQILTLTPRIPAEEVNRVKDQLREYTDRVTKGETTFATLARLYSEDPGTARQGGELGLTGRGMLDPAFAAVAFNLTDPRKISKIVETEFGYHIIQLIERRGEKVNCRHILLKPRISADETEQAKIRLDSVANEVRSGKYAFETAVAYLSDDKDTRNNNGLMVNSSESSRTSRFRMQDLPTEVARIVEKMQVGDLSDAFVMTNSRGKTVCALVKLKNRIDAHRASITEDFQAMKDIVMAHLREEKIKKWVADKIKDTYVRMSPEYQNCNFEYEGWMK